MIQIGFDTPTNENIDEEGNPVELKEGDKVLLREKRKTIKIPERRIPELLAQFDCVVVQDFGDEYHLSEKEREEKNQFYKIFAKFAKAKHKYRKLDEYVAVMRDALNCLNAVAESQNIYDVNKFKKMFLKGKLDIVGLQLPEYRGKDRKHISWDYLTEFILSDKDPKEILPKKKEELITKEDFEEAEKVLFDDIDKTIEENSLPEEYPIDYDETLDNPEEFVLDMDKKEFKDFLKFSPEYMYVLKELKKKSESLENLSRFAFNMVSEDIEMISEYDKKNNSKWNGSEPPEFTGDIMNDKDYNKYLEKLDRWEEENVYVEYKGQLKTLEKAQFYDTLSVLEENGFNIMKFYGEKERRKKLAKLEKRDRKKQKAIKKKLIEYERRRNRKLGDDYESVKKKKKKVKKFKDHENDFVDDFFYKAGFNPDDIIEF